ncbi:hypothetical protein QBC33DRAFT_564905 [Phialemonium atrogriseum]|uniref:Uncharacterized protein n=1 Tax=Phialemonium atrogriseum TaxID=1093897 RepID=A0AAJ0CBG9_9PEZI|nr:uncharacterized protein QBC33DRAFT_564905 [Phialemonium atrogriseum]KAK1772428.1 hypothetical protein QBC33DRAFT_564905 [Phialemonium atrogriseum]
MERVEETSNCGYSFNKTEANENGGWAKGDPGDHHSDPPRCLQNCREQFLEQVSHDYIEDFAKACAPLTKDGPNQGLWPLYWCDSTFCGVYIDRNGPLGQDPNVDLVINQCQSVGYYSIIDPGPPAPNYSCSTYPKPPYGATGKHSKLHGSTQTTISASISKTSTPASISASTPEFTPGFTPAVSILATQSGMPTAPSGAEQTLPFSSVAPPVPTAAPNADLSTGAKAAIATCSGLGLLALISLTLFLLRWRNRGKAARPPGVKDRIRLWRDDPRQPPGSSPQRLISPAQSTTSMRSALTPPLRLRDRKFLLPAILLRPAGGNNNNSNRPPSPPLTPLTPVNSYPGGGVFPSSPICSPTTNRLVPRREPAPRTNHHHHHQQAARSSHSRSRGSLSGGSIAPSTKSATSISATAQSSSSLRNETLPGTSSLSLCQSQSQQQQQQPTRPPRPHETPLEIPDLVTPTTRPGPPPTKALPPPPPPPLLPPPVVVSGPAAAARQAATTVGFGAVGRGPSWGSWEGGAGGAGEMAAAQGIGIAISPPEGGVYSPRETWGTGGEFGSVSSVGEGFEDGSSRVSVLREEVLERLGAAY